MFYTVLITSLCRDLLHNKILKYFDLKIMDNYLQNRQVIQKELKTVVSYVSIVIVLVPRSLMVVARSLMVVASKLMKRAVITTEVFKTTC